MDYHHSTLELVIHDETARAPERDWDATAFEVDTSASAPQVVFDTSPQVVYDNSFPEVHENIEDSAKERTPSHHTAKPGIKWILMIMASVVAIAIAVGVGIGIWRHRDHRSHSPPAPSSAAPQHPATNSSRNNTSATQYILNDTSLAALVLSDGTRQLFFQDNNGFIRHAIHSATEDQWTVSSSLHLGTNPKNHTPIAASVYSLTALEDNFEIGPVTIGLHYVSESHIIIATSFDQGNWTSDTKFGNRSTAVDTRSLSFCVLPDIGIPYNASENLALLFYENSTKQVSALLQRVQKNSSLIQWVDITSQESRSLPDEFRNTLTSTLERPIGVSSTLYESNTLTTFNAPFTSMANTSNGATRALFYSPKSMFGFVATEYNTGTSGPGIFHSDQLLGGDSSDDHTWTTRSDVATFGTGYFIWINGTQPVTLTLEAMLLPATPKSSFPFARLASGTFSSTTYLYHQINGTTFAEEQWDDSEKAWGATEYINVSDPSIQGDS